MRRRGVDSISPASYGEDQLRESSEESSKEFAEGVGGTSG